MTSTSDLPSPAASAEFVASLDREIRRALLARATSEEELPLQGGRRVRSGGDGPHEYVFSCHRWWDSPGSPGSAGFLVRPPGSRGPWHSAEALPALGGKVHVTTDADLGPAPGDLLLRAATLPGSRDGQADVRIEVSSLHERFGTVVPPEVIAERLGAGVRARATELFALLEAARTQVALHDRLGRTQVAVDRARFREDRVSAETALRESEARRARRALERAERGLRRVRAPFGPFAARRAARIGRAAARVQELRSALVTALRERAVAAERLADASGAVAFRVRERDHALEATRGLPAARDLAERIDRMERELDRLRLLDSPPAPPRPRPPLEDAPHRPAVPAPGDPREDAVPDRYRAGGRAPEYLERPDTARTAGSVPNPPGSAPGTGEAGADPAAAA
ncbi:hypothetical protein SAMN05421803_102114 [Nocardiopsis flavescens]|uniref:Uncharacterized protein n=1 Tax=Nocardiopsis flavescens TaxID=758803 RepID=A0A1M6E1Z7_9ACTN|nr:hypothetical protein [Nocardiopsis flavescens]SHI79413.1 hypothetical protein SAMN05421803_102114 [Nocardiopsis flavescens]